MSLNSLIQTVKHRSGFQVRLGQPKGGIVYFDEPGGDNTEEVFRITKKRAAELGIQTVVIATASGHTGVRATEVFEDMKVVAVTLPTGFWKPYTQELTKKNRQKIVANGGFILTTTPLFGGIGRLTQVQVL